MPLQQHTAAAAYRGFFDVRSLNQGQQGFSMAQPTVPKEYGGGGLSKEEIKILNEETIDHNIIKTELIA